MSKVIKTNGSDAESDNVSCLASNLMKGVEIVLYFHRNHEYQQTPRKLLQLNEVQQKDRKESLKAKTITITNP